MLGGKKPDVGVRSPVRAGRLLLRRVPLRRAAQRVLGTGELWAGHIFTQALGAARSQQTTDRIKRQLGLVRAHPRQTLDKPGVEAIAVTGSDPFLSEGSDVTLLVQGKKVPALVRPCRRLEGRGPAGEGQHVDIAYTRPTTPDGTLNAFAATPRPDLHVRVTRWRPSSRVLDCVGRGKPAKRLGDSAEFRYIRTLMARGAARRTGSCTCPTRSSAGCRPAGEARPSGGGCWRTTTCA